MYPKGNKSKDYVEHFVPGRILQGSSPDLIQPGYKSVVTLSDFPPMWDSKRLRPIPGDHAGFMLAPGCLLESRVLADGHVQHRYVVPKVAHRF